MILSAFGPRRGRGVSESRRWRLRELTPPRRRRRDAVAAARDAPARRYVVKNIPMEMVVAGADSASELELWEDGVLVVSRHRDAVDVNVQRQFRDGLDTQASSTTSSGAAP